MTVQGDGLVAAMRRAFFVAAIRREPPAGKSVRALQHSEQARLLVAIGSVALTGRAMVFVELEQGGLPGARCRLTSGSISSGQTLQVRMTTSSSVSTVLTATVTVGSSSANWTTTTRSATLKIFITANGYVPSFGGLSAADAICQSEAGTAGYAGTYKAVMSDNTTSAASRLTLSYPIVNAYNGSTVSATNLWSGSVSNSILNPSGGTMWNWSGSNSNGTIATGLTCTSWTNSTSGSVEQGETASTNGGWIATGTGTCGGGNAVDLICIQQ